MDLPPPLSARAVAGETKGGQWWNRDIGYGRCDECAKAVEERWLEDMGEVLRDQGGALLRNVS